ncbi:tRNA 4-thiouridine(8) synthase ThiI [Candidatus Poribacteria bacterium]|nr:MAG: tRNA 4-thiouridine(8) synthase ThiI [Candidatus Poribacteria bacterium]
MGGKRPLGVGLLSGGLDSILAFRILQEQDIELLAVSFTTPFFEATRAIKAAEMLGVPIIVLDITEEYLEMLKAPKYGYGSQMNPCIDCHALMFRKAGRIMEEKGGDFLFSGEVLDERPFSQRRWALKAVEKLSGYEGYILRPLSAKLLPETIPEKEGKVDRERLLDLRGRSRKRQMELAERFGIKEYPSPAGGCRLTEPGFATRLKDLMENEEVLRVRDIELLKVGRHFRLAHGAKAIVGRNRFENEKLLNMVDRAQDVLIRVVGHKGPLTLVPRGVTVSKDRLLTAARICVRYSDAPKDGPVKVALNLPGSVEYVEARAASEEELDELRVAHKEG